MNKHISPFPPRPTRLGFHYFQDTLHFRESDLSQWIPELTAMGASWLVIQSPLDRAIPELFINGLSQSGIEPLIEFKLPLYSPVALDDLEVLIKSYARWGCHGIIFYDRPNDFKSWGQAHWARHDLVERFLDRFVPVAEIAANEGLSPILAPLEPGGSYWDTSFLRSSLKSLLRRATATLMDKIVLSAYAFYTHNNLNWGAGGFQKWPGARPYYTPDDQQNHIGFYIFEWYQEIATSILQREYPILLLSAGSPPHPQGSEIHTLTAEEHLEVNIGIARLLDLELARADVENTQPMPINENLIACNYWLLAAEENTTDSELAWFSPSMKYAQTIESLKEWSQSRHSRLSSSVETSVENHHPLNHYLLLPKFEWGVADWYLDVIRPYVKKNLPVIGFSLEEALLANQVTVIGGENAFSTIDIERLVMAGCKVRRIVGDGTSIATQLAER